MKIFNRIQMYASKRAILSMILLILLNEKLTQQLGPPLWTKFT